MKNRKKKARRVYRKANRLRLESLETRLPLHGEGCVGENCAPDLHMEDVDLQSTRVNEQIVVDLYALGAMTTDVDEGGMPTGDTIRLQLDPDDGPSNATLTSDGIFRWTPTIDQIGAFEFVVIAVDAGTPPLADAEILTVEVLANEAPNLSEISDFTLAVNQELEVNLSASDPEGDSLAFAVDPDQSPAGISIEQIDNNSAVLRWTPGAGHAGQSVIISLLVTDDGFPPMSDNEVFVVNVMSVAAVNDTYSLAADAVLNVDSASGVLANDSDSDNDPLTATIVDQPANGTISLSEDGSFVYTPNTGFQGADTFTYQAQDGNGDTSIGTVTIHVNSRPIAVDDSFTTLEDTTLTVDVDSGVSANDSDADGDNLTASIVQAPGSGTLTLNDDGSFEYVPVPNFNGTVAFTYIVSDGLTDSEEATVTIEVVAENDAPVAVADTYTTDEDQQLAVTSTNGILSNDSDEDSNNLTAELVDPPANGMVTLDADGAFVYTPDENYNGTDGFTYIVSDGETSSPVTLTTIEVVPINDAPVANADTYAVAEGLELSIDATSGVLANDVDVDGDPVTAQLISGTTNGILALNSDGSFTYTSDVGFSGTDTFTYSITDGLGESGVVTVAIFVSDVNQTPVATADSYSATEDEVLIIDAASGVLANDSDADGDTLTAILIGEPTQGSLVFNADGSFQYTPNQDSTGLDGFSYQASDGVTTSGETLVFFTIAISNDAPVAEADSFEVSSGNILSIDASEGVLANDTDVEGDSLTAIVVDEPANGTLSFSSDGSFTYEPDANFSGTDTFSYQASDGSDASAVVLVTINVTATEFGAVIVGSFEDPSISGIRTDLEPGALPLVANHTTTAVDYSGYSNPPTYGPHHGFFLDSSSNPITPRPTGVYQTEQPDEDLVHNLEHGNVWISYNPSLISPDDLAALEQLVINGGTNTGVILTPRAANTEAIALASWARLLTLDSFDAAQIRTFIETNRGKAPEGFIPSGQKSDGAASENLTDGLSH